MTKREHFLECIMNLTAEMNKELFYENYESAERRMKWMLNELNDFINDTGDYDDKEFNERFNWDAFKESDGE